jgi:hypothetical protein
MTIRFSIFFIALWSLATAADLAAEQCHRPERFSDWDLAPLEFRNALLRKFPHSLGGLDEPQCTTYRSATLCTVKFSFLTIDSRRGSFECRLHFYGGEKDAVLEKVGCSVWGAGDHLITGVEQRQLWNIGNGMLEVLVEQTDCTLSPQVRATLLNDLRNGKSPEVAAWHYSPPSLNQSFPNEIELGASRDDFLSVRKEHQRRFGSWFQRLLPP